MPATDLLLSSISHARQLTFAPRTPAPPRKQLSRTSALARVGYGGVYPGRGQMSSTSSDDGGPRATPRLICRCVTVRSLYVRITSSVVPGKPRMGKAVIVELE